ncbi:MAG TPA: hypothetical protein DCY94_04950 [Firmicutes bacterium]|nr:hypothetical protein [Bacillota bacterium]
MKNRDIEEIKKSVRKAYKKLESNDDRTSLLDILRLFYIKIDESRMEDFYIESIDIDALSIVVVDEKTKTVYRANFVGDSVNVTVENSILKDERKRIWKLLELFCLDDEISFKDLEKYEITKLDFGSIELVDRKNNIVYHSIIEGSKERIITVTASSQLWEKEFSYVPIVFSNGMTYCRSSSELIFKKGDREIRLWKDESGHVADENISISYLINNKDSKGMCDTQVLFTREFSKGYYYDIERTLSGIGERVNQKCSDKKGVSFLVDRGASMRGFAIEDCNSEMAIKVFDNTSVDSDPYRFRKPNVQAMIYFYDSSGRFLRVLKTREGIELSYKDKYLDRNFPDRNISLPVLSLGALSIEEVDSIINALNLGFVNPSFAGIVNLELAKFRREIAINKGFEGRKDDIIDPVRLCDCSIDKLAEMFALDQDALFEEVERQYRQRVYPNSIAMVDLKSYRMKVNGVR